MKITLNFIENSKMFQCHYPLAKFLYGETKRSFLSKLKKNCESRAAHRPEKGVLEQAFLWSATEEGDAYWRRLQYLAVKFKLRGEELQEV